MDPQKPADFKEVGLSGAKERLRLAKNARQRYEGDWFLNLAFFQDEQWVAWDGRGLFKPKLRAGRITLTDNRIKGIIRTEVARLTKARPGWAATPREADDHAVTSAQAATRLLEWGYDHFDFAAHRREALMWARICSAGFIKTTWDPTIGGGTEILVNSASGQAIPNPQTGKPARPGEMPEVDAIDGVETKRIGGGDVSVCTRSPFDIYPDPLATSLDDARWIIDESVRSAEYVKERYGVDVSPDAPSQVGIVEQGFATSQLSASTGELVGIRVFEMWEPPSKGNPHGRRMVFSDSAVLYEGPNEYEGIPYVMVPGITVPGRFWPDGTATSLRPIQARWNKTISQVAENLSKFGNPAVLIDKLSGVDYHGTPGERIKHNGANNGQAPITFLEPPNMPGYGFNFLQQMESSFREISGQYEVAQGTVPAGVTAASAISLLQEQDATRLGPDVEALEIALGKVGQLVIKLMARYYTTDRIVVLAGEEGIIDIDTFRADASFQVPDITVQPMSTFPRSLAAKQAQIRDTLNLFLQYGVPIDAGAMAKALRDMQVGGVEHLVGGWATDTNQVAREHVDLMRGGELVVGEVDNHAAHVAGHEDFAKGLRFRSLPPQQQQALLDHIGKHKTAEQLDAQQQQMQQMPGLPGAPQGAPGLPPGTLPTYPSGNPMASQPPPDQMAA